MQDAKEEVRSRLSVEDVIGDYVELKRAGRNLKGLSPFTDEKTPSFVVSPDKQIWHDFSSGKGGDIFSFIMLVEGVEFRESLELLARKAGVELKQFSGDGYLEKRRSRARQALSIAANFYQQSLVDSKAALDYVVKNRGFGRQIITDFQIGYAPDSRQQLVELLEKKAFSRQELKDAGLTNQYGGDLFRGRMMVALMDRSGQVIGFTGRSLTDDPKSPKYLNTPQTILFDKSRHIFALSQAREAIRQTGFAVIVEGNLDVVSSHQAAVKNVVATAGTAMTEHHLRLLARLTDKIKLAFDGDKAGLAATERAVILAQGLEVELEVIELPGQAKDPDELIKLDPRLWQQAIEAAVPAVQWAISAYADRQDLLTAAGKSHFTGQSLQLVDKLVDAVEKEHYLELISSKAELPLEVVKQKLSSLSQPKVSLKQSKVARQAPTKDHSEAEDLLIGLLISQPQTRRWISALQTDMLEATQSQQILEYLRLNPTADDQQLTENLLNLSDYVKIVRLKTDIRYADLDSDVISDEMARLVKQIITKKRNTKIQQLIVQLREQEAQGDEVAADALRQKLNKLIKERA